MGSTLKPAVIAAARQCVSQTSCDDVKACLDAWWKIFEA